MTLQEHYNAIKSGKGNKAQFLKQAKSLFPQYFNQYSDFDTATNVLKSKQIISEAAGGVISKGFDIWDWKKILAEEAKAEEKKTSKEVEEDQEHNFDNKDMKNADNVNFNEIMKGFYAELKDPKNHDKTGDEIKAMVVKNLAKDALHYTKDGMFGEKGVGYTTEAPGLGEPKEPKGKHKSSGYGDLDTDKKVEKVKANVQDSLGDKEAKTSDPKKVKEMTMTPKNSTGVKKMKMPGAEKKMKLQENINDLTSFHKGSHSTGRPDFNKMTADEIEDYLEQDKDKVGGLYGRSLDIVKDILKKKKEDLMYQDTDSNLNEPISESKLRSVIAKLIKEELKKSNSGAEYIEINGKIVKTYTQNGDKSYNVMYDDGTKDVIMVSNDAWDEINKTYSTSLNESKLRSIIRSIIKEELNK
jgi:hypothetical protein